MSGGESHAASLMWFSRCPGAAGSCEWKVYHGGPCADHGGPRNRPQYRDGADGEMYTRGFPRVQRPDFDPAA